MRTGLYMNSRYFLCTYAGVEGMCSCIVCLLLIVVTVVYRIEINFNVNHSVDTDCEPEVNPSADKTEVELKAKPTFEVDLKRGGHTLGFTCSYIAVQPDQGDDSYSKYLRMHLYCDVMR